MPSKIRQTAGQNERDQEPVLPQRGSGKTAGPAQSSLLWDLIPRKGLERTSVKTSIKNLLVLAAVIARLGLILSCCVAKAGNNGMQYQIPADEYNALVDLYNRTGGNAWGNNDGWLDGQASNWDGVYVEGVQCDSNGNVVVQGHVTSVGRNYNQLSGTIPSSLGNLANLQYLDLGINQLSGTIPSSLGNSGNLQYLDLRINQLSGTIPSSLGNLANLQYLYLYDNQLSGTIPSSLTNLANLSYLAIETNCLAYDPGSANTLLIQALEQKVLTVVYGGLSSACSGDVTLTGHVYCTCDGSPIAGACVLIAGSSAASDSGGSYSISNIPPATYSATVSQPNYFTTNTTVTIPSGSSTVTSDFTLTPSGYDIATLKAIVPPSSVNPSSAGSLITATFTPALGLTVSQAACRLGFNHFNWFQTASADSYKDLFYDCSSTLGLRSLPCFIDPPQFHCDGTPNCVRTGPTSCENADNQDPYYNEGLAYPAVFTTQSLT